MKPLRITSLILALVGLPLAIVFAQSSTSSDSSELNNPNPQSCGVTLELPDFLARNTDDDQEPDVEGYEQWDLDDIPSTGDDDLKEVIVTGTAGKTPGTLGLKIVGGGGGKINSKFWKDAEKNQPETQLTWSVAAETTLTKTLYIEGYECSDEVNDVEMKATMDCPAGTGSGGQAYEAASADSGLKTTTVYEADLDVDSDNENQFEFAGFTDEEDKLENSDKVVDGHLRPGKIVITNSQLNSDGDDVPDFADGFNLDVGNAKVNELANVSDNLKFVPVQVELKEPFDPAAAMVTFAYDASKPELSGEGIELSGEGTAEDPYVFTLKRGGMRLWKKKATERSSGDKVPAGDFVPADEEINWSDIAESGSRTAQLYIEYVVKTVPEAASRKKIKVTATQGDVETSDTVNVSLLPVDLAVDANRDGEITFDGKDKTTAEKPFRFWINNDQDDVEADEPILVENPDSFDNEIIQTKRDLEDFCRLKLQVGLSNQTLRDGDFQIGLMFKGGSGSSPGIRIWKNQSNEGNLDYLKDHNAAAAQIALGAFEKFPPLQVTLIPKDYWASRSDSTAHLIFEGTSKGKGELVVTIHDKHGAKLGEGSGIWMDLLDVREMYQRARVANEAEQIPSPATNPTPPAQTWIWDPWNWPYSEDPQATEKTAIFVHGWRLKYMDYMNWSDTSYKRLWHQGFKGKFYSFRWATFSGDNNGLPYGYDENIEGTAFPPGGTTYNASEYRAWLCGPTLASFVNQLPNAGNRSLFAHSMGNVISGAALRSGMLIDRYAMCNAAMAAMAYDPDPILRNVDNIFIPGTIPETPDTNSDPAIRTVYGLENKFNLPGSPTVFNFGLPDDTALGSWSANNLFFKPEFGSQYYYIPAAISVYHSFPLAFRQNDLGSFRSVTSLSEAMGYVTKSRTRTAGSDLRTSGKIVAGNKIDMSSWGAGANHSGFGNTHSAQWRWSNQSTELFWKELSIRLILKEENP